MLIHLATVCTTRIPTPNEKEKMAKKKKRAAKRILRRRWSKEENRELRAHSKARTPVAKIARVMQRSVGALRQQAFKLGLGLGHQR
jgi:hypothetical protein